MFQLKLRMETLLWNLLCTYYLWLWLTLLDNSIINLNWYEILPPVLASFGLLFKKTRLCSLPVLFSAHWLLYYSNSYMTSPESGLMNWLLIHATVYLILSEQKGLLRWIQFEAIWWILSLVYLHSAIEKLKTLSWRDGTAMTHILSGAFATPLSQKSLVLLPSAILSGLTWAIVGLHFCFLLVVWPNSKIRFYISCLFIALYIGIFILTDLKAVALGMIILHLYALYLSFSKVAESKTHP